MITKKRLYEILDRIEEKANNVYAGMSEDGMPEIYGIETLENYIRNIKYNLQIGLEP